MAYDNEDDGNLTTRIAMLNYSSSKIRDHINYLLGFIGVWIAYTNVHEYFNVKYMLPLEVVIIFSLGPFIYLIGRTFFWGKFVSGIMVVSPVNENEIELLDNEEFNEVVGFNRAADRYVILRARAGPFSRIAVRFNESIMLFRLTLASLSCAIFIWGILRALADP